MWPEVRAVHLAAERLVARRSVQPHPVRLEAARLDVPAALHREHPVRPSAAAARKVRALPAMGEAEAMAAQRLAQAERLEPPALQAAEGAAAVAQQVSGVSAAQPQAAPEVWDVAVVPRPAAEPAGAVRRLGVAAVQDVAAAVQRPAAGPASVAVRPRGAAGVRDAEGRRRGARDAQAVLPLAAAWAAVLSIRCRGGPAPSTSARSAHAGRQLQTVRP
jgi:hypothetical protein